jgi:hypothetical protein
MLDHPEDYYDILRELMRLRGKLLSLLAEQDAPPGEYARPFWDAHNLLVEGTEALKRATGYEEPAGDTGWTTYDDDAE